VTGTGNAIAGRSLDATDASSWDAVSLVSEGLLGDHCGERGCAEDGACGTGDALTASKPPAQSTTMLPPLGAGPTNIDPLSAACDALIKLASALVVKAWYRDACKPANTTPTRVLSLGPSSCKSGTDT
jgi:hypothetical protein